MAMTHHSLYSQDMETSGLRPLQGMPRGRRSLAPLSANLAANPLVMESPGKSSTYTATLPGEAYSSVSKVALLARTWPSPAYTRARPPSIVRRYPSIPVAVHPIFTSTRPHTRTPRCRGVWHARGSAPRKVLATNIPTCPSFVSSSANRIWRRPGRHSRRSSSGLPGSTRC